MAVIDIDLKWAHSLCQGSPGYLTNDVIFLHSDYTIETLNREGKPLRSTIEPGIRIGCSAASAEIGVLAVCEKSGRPDIFILNYPQMEKISTLRRENTVKNLALQFTGLDYLVSVSYNSSYDIELWKWHTAERLYHIADQLQSSEIPEIRVSVNPIYWNEICVQSNTQIRILDIKGVEDRQTIKVMKRVLFYDNEEDSFRIVSPSDNGNNDEQSQVSITCHTWLSKDLILIETSNGLVKVDPFMYQAFPIFREDQSKQVITSMALNNEGLFVGYESGYMDVVNISRGRWFVLEPIKIGQPVSHMILSPHYDCLAIATTKGSVFLHQGGSYELQVLLKTDAAGQIGLCHIGPLSQYCMFARKNGLLNLVKTANGSLASCMQLEEELTSVAGSPLCGLVLAGSNCGFLYFVDVAEPKHPKVVHCVKPHEAAIEVIKFSNYGRVIATSAEQNNVSIWNGMPSSGFEFLGSLQFPKPVKDLALFRREIGGDLSLFVLSVTGPTSEIGAGNVLMCMSIPVDFLKNSQKYHTDDFKTINSDCLHLKEWRLDHPCAKMDVHQTLGVLFYSPILRKIQRFPVWSKSDRKQVDVLKDLEIDSLCVSHNQEWLGFMDIYGSFQLYNISQKKVSAIVNVPNASSNCRNFLNFNAFGDGIMAGCETGYSMFYTWTYKQSGVKSIPQWIVFCQVNAEKENNCLKKMSEEESVDFKLRDLSTIQYSPVSYAEMQHKFKKYTDILEYRLNNLSEVDVADGTVKEFVLNERSLQILSEKNFKNLQSLGSQIQMESTVQDKKAKNCSYNEIKAISSTTLQYIVHNYVAIEELHDFVSEHTLHDSRLAEFNHFIKNLKSKKKEGIFFMLQENRKITRDWKTEFNQEFERMYNTKDEVADRITDLVSEMKSNSARLPSKAERDFYGAMFLPRDFSYRQFEEQLKRNSKKETSFENEPVQSSDSSKESVESVKKSIEELSKQVNDIRRSFDADVERLSFHKSFCDYVIHFHQVQTLCILLFTEAESQYSQCKKEMQEEVKSLQLMSNNLNPIIDEAKNLQKKSRETYDKTLKFERRIDEKIEHKCNKLGLGDYPYFFYRKKPDIKFLLHTRIPFCEPSYTLTDKDLTLDYLDMHTETPKNVDSEKWDRICGQRTKHIKLSIILRYLQFQAMQVTSLIYKIEEAKMKVEEKIYHCQGILVEMKNLFEKLSDDLLRLLQNHLERGQLKFTCKQVEKEEFHSLTKLPGTDEEVFWNKVRENSLMNRNVERELEEIQSLLKSWWKLREEILTQQDMYHEKVSGLTEEVKDMLKSRQEAFERSEPIIHDVIDEKKKSLLRLFR